MSLDMRDPAVIEWGTASAALATERESGDLAVVCGFTNGALVAVIDGLGHGPEAALAARTAGQLLTDHAQEDPLSLVQRCHEGLRKTRGAVMSLASWNQLTDSLTWLGVGNVEGVLVRRSSERASESLALRGGVVGYRLPPLRSELLSVARGDTLVFATDGLRSNFTSHIELGLAPQELADALLAGSSKGSDDACVAVARYVAVPSVRVPIRHVSDVSAARVRLRELAYRRGFQEAAVEGLAIAISELAHNIVVHAGSGEISIAFAEHGQKVGVCIVAHDDGPGMADIERSMEDGYSTAGGLGLGLSSVRRLVDEFSVRSSPGQGTEVTLRKWLP